MASVSQEVKVITRMTEWVGAQDSDDEPNEAHERAVYQAREKRLSVAEEKLKIFPVLGDVEVDILPQKKEWQAVVDSDEDDSPKRRNRHNSDMFDAREKRLAAGGKALSKENLIGDTDVVVLPECKEWDGLKEESDDEGGQLEGHATASFEAREKRLSVSEQILKDGAPVVDADIGA
mmetsp:Transcript_65174/g.172673  ORF Transcript_65174/g.172673 Transcript_65174/m.172673 type:complete len:177 (-) Transcript_65174:180-710(-)